MSKYTLEIVVFVSGAVLMILELVGSRILAPYLGTTIIVWTSLIGVILGSLSFGYWYGGKLADKKPEQKILTRILFFSGVLIGLTAILKVTVLDLIHSYIHNYRIACLFATLILFAPASIVLGMVSPYAIRLKMEKVNKAGRTVGNLYAVSTIGSIAGTFFGGFYLIAYIGSTEILYLLAFVQFFLAFLTGMRMIISKNIVILIVFFTLTSITHLYINKILRNPWIVYEGDTLYNTVKIFDDNSGKPIRYMFVNGANYSSMYLYDDELSSDYTKFYHLVKHFNPNFKDVLMIGGAAYSYPKSYLMTYPETRIDVVEIDPALTKLARNYFGLKDDYRLKIYHEDGRTFLNRTKNKYDAILGDAFNYYFVPYQLATKEAVKRMDDILNEDGVVIMNIVVSIDSEFLKTEYITYKSVFPQVYLFALGSSEDRSMLQNIMLVALKSYKQPDFQSDDTEVNSYLQKILKEEIKTNLPILTDNYAPVDHYMMKMFNGGYF